MYAGSSSNFTCRGFIDFSSNYASDSGGKMMRTCVDGGYGRGLGPISLRAYTDSCGPDTHSFETFTTLDGFPVYRSHSNHRC